MADNGAHGEEFEIDLNAMDNDELARFETLLVGEYKERRAAASTDEDVAELAAIKEVVASVRDEMARRVELASDDEFIDEVVGEDFGMAMMKAKKAKKAKKPPYAMFQKAAADEEDEDMEEEVTADVEAAAEVEETKAPEVVISPKGLKGDEPVVAAATKPLARIAADVRGFRSGQEVESWKDVARAIINRHPDTRAADVTSGARFLVASLEAEYPESRILGDDVVVNTARIEAVTSDSAITASGGLCAPLTPWYNLQTWGDVCRPVRDALPNFKADRGGIRFITPPRISDLSGSARVTTAAQDAAGYTNQDPAGTTAPKPCLHVTCGSEETAVVQATSSCLTFGNMGARTYPEQVEAWLKLARVEFARYQESLLIEALHDNATYSISPTQVYGATFSLLEQVAITVDSFKSRYRLCNGVKLRMIAPFWMKGILRADIAAQHPGDGLARYSVSDAQIEDWLRMRGVEATWTQEVYPGDDDLLSPNNGLYYPCSLRWTIFPEGQWLYLDNGVLDLGLVRDSTLNSQNDYQVWMEEFVGLAQVGGGESLSVLSTIVADGSAAPTAAELRACDY